MTEPKKRPGLEALHEAHRLAVAPFAFQSVASLKALGILALLDKHFGVGLTEEAIATTLNLDAYTLSLLLPAGEVFGVLARHDDRWDLSRVGYFLLNDPLVKVNFDFTEDVCYAGLAYLTESLKTQSPAGLKVFGDWASIYPHLRDLPEPAKTSWFAFDHYYSDNAYRDVLPIVFREGVKHLVDIGGNTGKWALACTQYDKDVHVTICDLPPQCETALANAQDAGVGDRIDACPMDLLAGKPLPALAAQVWWMSQFLDCFAPSEVISILKRVHEAMDDNATLYILEPLTDQQPYEAGRVALVALSIYFTTMANGNSRFYSLEDFRAFLAAAGFDIRAVHAGVGAHSSLLECVKTGRSH